MKIPLTILNLLHQRLRTLVAIAGVAFSMLLVFMQLGFYGAVKITATLAVEIRCPLTRVFPRIPKVRCRRGYPGSPA